MNKVTYPGHWNYLPLLLSNVCELCKSSDVLHTAIDWSLQLIPQMFDQVLTLGSAGHCTKVVCFQLTGLHVWYKNVIYLFHCFLVNSCAVLPV